MSDMTASGDAIPGDDVPEYPDDGVDRAPWLADGLHVDVHEVDDLDELTAPPVSTPEVTP